MSPLLHHNGILLALKTWGLCVEFEMQGYVGIAVIVIPMIRELSIVRIHATKWR